jgi:hypothetical protein
MAQLKKMHSFHSFPATDTELESRHEYCKLSFKLPTGDECVGYRRVIRSGLPTKVFMLPLYDPSHQLSKSSNPNKYTEQHQKCTILKNTFKTL